MGLSYHKTLINIHSKFHYNSVLIYQPICAKQKVSLLVLKSDFYLFTFYSSFLAATKEAFLSGKFNKLLVSL